MKIGQGLKFLPRILRDLLTNNLKVLLEELDDTGECTIRNNVASVLEELVRRKGINREWYTFN